MEACEMCGAKASLTTTKVASSTMNLCPSCKKHGRVERNDYFSSNKKVFHKKRKALSREVIVENYNSLISSALHQRGLNSHQLARAINLKESSLNKFLTGKIQPEIDVARKIEKFLEITLIREEEEGRTPEDYFIDDEEEEGGTSLGDLIKHKMNKKND